MIGYKLFRVRKDGTLGSLFIHRDAILPIGKRLTARSYPTKGFALRPGFHICALPSAPHLSTKGRKWYMVEFSGNVKRHERPQSQGGLWYTARYMKIIKEIDNV